MPLVRIQKLPTTTQYFVAEEPISRLATIYLTPGASVAEERRVKEGVNDYQERVGGVALAAALSGKLVRVATHGMVDGVICASSVMLGDRVAIANSSGHGVASGLVSGHGMITPFSTITPAGTVARVSGSLKILSGGPTSGAIASGFVSGLIALHGLNLVTPASGMVSGIAAFDGFVPPFTGTPFNTARVLGKALASGGLGSGIRVLVTLGG